MKILVFGSTGLLGAVLCRYLCEAGHEVIGFRRSPETPCCTEKEITSVFASAIKRATPQCIINLVGATNVDECQKNMGHAVLLNCFVPQMLINFCQRGEHLIHLSSDQVYEGPGPHDESSTRPVNIYGLTKFVGEYPVVQAGGCVLRTNFFGKSRTSSRKSLSDWLVSEGRSGHPIRVFKDVWFSPLGMSSLCAAIHHVAKMRLTGLFNVGASDGVSKAEFARMLFKQLGLDRRLLRSVSVNHVKIGATRPHDMRMDSSLFRRITGFDLQSVQREVEYEANEYARS